jgi:hypothetical protein
MDQNLLRDIELSFKTLIENYGYEIKQGDYDPTASDNIVILLCSQVLTLKLTLFRNAFYLDINSPQLPGTWVDFFAVIRYVSKNKKEDYIPGPALKKQLAFIASKLEKHYEQIATFFNQYELMHNLSGLSLQKTKTVRPHFVEPEEVGAVR